MAEETAWLIECADPRHPGCVLGAHFLGIEGFYDGIIGNGRLAWLSTVNGALRFGQQKDALMFIGMMEQLSDKLPHGETLPGLRSGETRAMAVEHLWTDGGKGQKLSDAQIKHMVDRFLGWKLPENFSPDGGVSFEPIGNKGTPYEYRREVSGTNLIDATQADVMVRYMLEGMPE